MSREKSKGPPASSYAGHWPPLAANLSPEDRTTDSEVISFQKRGSPLSPGVLPKEIPEYMADVLTLFQELTQERRERWVALHW